MLYECIHFACIWIYQHIPTEDSKTLSRVGLRVRTLPAEKHICFTRQQTDARLVLVCYMRGARPAPHQCQNCARLATDSYMIVTIMIMCPDWSAYSDSPYGELNLEPKKHASLICDKWRLICTKYWLLKWLSFTICMSINSRDVAFSEKKLRGAQQHRPGLGSTFLSLFAANHTAFCRYLPLTLPLFAAICR